MLDQRLKYEKALNIKKTRPNWARKVRDLDMSTMSMSTTFRSSTSMSTMSLTTIMSIRGRGCVEEGEKKMAVKKKKEWERLRDLGGEEKDETEKEEGIFVGDGRKPVAVRT